MPSLRAVNEAQARTARHARIELARRRAAELGVMTARSYVAAKQEQDALVAQELAGRHSVELGRRIADMDRALYETQTREGQGFLLAEAHAQQRGAVAEVELDAWEAEKALERERFALALRREQLIKTQGDLAKQEIAQRRQAVKEMELNRSRASVSSHNRSRVLQQQHLNASGSPTGGNYSVQLLAGGAKEPAHVVAERHKAERAAAQQAERERVAHQRRCIAERAVSAVAQQKEDEQRRILEEEQDVLLRLTMIENAMRSTVRPISSSDFQEQEARKAQSASSKAAQDFEKTFLASAVWPLNDIRRTHHAPVESAVVLPSSSSDASAAASIFADSSVALLLASPSATRLQPRLFEPSLVEDEDEESSPAADADQPDVMNTSVEGPRCSDSQPQPMPRTSTSPPAPAEDGQNPSLASEPPRADEQHAAAQSPKPPPQRQEDRPTATPSVPNEGSTAGLHPVQPSRPPLGPTLAGSSSPAPAAPAPAGSDAADTDAPSSSGDGAVPAALTAAAPVLRERHEQFLRDLQRLQQRLAKASMPDDEDEEEEDSGAAHHPLPGDRSSSAADGINDSTSTTMTSEGSDVSLSSMSADADGTLRPRKASSGMTAEQLRNALRKMKFGRQ